MITLEDCIGLCGLTEEEVLAIAEHEHLPEIAATADAHLQAIFNTGTVEKRLKEMLAVRVSQINDCAY